MWKSPEINGTGSGMGVFIHACVCVCVCVCERERERDVEFYTQSTITVIWGGGVGGGGELITESYMPSKNVLDTNIASSPSLTDLFEVSMHYYQKIKNKTPSQPTVLNTG